MVYTVNRPIIIRKNFGTADSYTYKKYTVAFKYVDDLTQLTTDWTDIYFGKAWVGADGYAEIEITDVVRNYANRAEYKYQNTTQKWVPNNYVDITIPSIGMVPIEMGGNWRTTYFRIYETTDETWEEIIEITNLFYPETYSDGEITNPYDSQCADITASINYSDFLPHVPYIETDNYYIDFESILGADGIQSSITDIPLTSALLGNSAIMRYNGYGNYSVSMNLKQFYNTFVAGTVDIIDAGAALNNNDYINADDADSVYPMIYGFGADLTPEPVSGGYDVIYGDGNELFTVDMCPARYYISWITPFGEWQSQPLKSVNVMNDSDNFNIKPTKRTLLNIENRTSATFACKTNILQPEKYKLFATMQYAPYVLLYDVEKDKSYYCVFDNTTNVKYRVKTPEIFSFNLKQINTTIN